MKSSCSFRLKCVKPILLKVSYIQYCILFPNTLVFFFYLFSSTLISGEIFLRAWRNVENRYCLGITRLRGPQPRNELFPKLNDVSFKRNYSLHLSQRRRHFAHLLRSGESATSLTSYSFPADPRPIPARRSVFRIRKLAEPTGNTCRTPEIGFRSGIINRSRIKNNLVVDGLLCAGEQLVLRCPIYVALL